VVTASYDGTARIWNAATGTREHELTGHTDSILAVAISADASESLRAPRTAPREYGTSPQADASMNWPATQTPLMLWPSLQTGLVQSLRPTTARRGCGSADWHL